MAPQHQPSSTPATPRRLWILAAFVWAVGLAIGFRFLVRYELKAGQPADGPTSWTAVQPLRFDATVSNLVMFVHPQCPCSRASVAELAVIMTKCQGQLRATVCFFDPAEQPQAWTQSALWRSAAAIPGVEVVADRDGKIAEHFNSATSGQVFVFDREGRRVYAGGITGARGHEGENRGRNIVVALARGELCSASNAAVFGCSLIEAAPATTKNFE